VTRRPFRLSVFLYDHLAGWIERDGGALTFRYAAEYLRSRSPTPLSLSMPLAESPYSKKRVEAFLKGLLPDNADVRRRWAGHFGLRDGDTFGLVASIGSDAAGGAIYLNADSEGSTPSTGSLEPVTDAEIAERLRRLRVDSTAWLDHDEHWSLAGAQSKFTLRRTSTGWAIPHGTEPSTHIVKPGIIQLRGQALTEHVSMRTARNLGLDVADTEFREFDDQPAIVVTRFDRLQRGDRLVRVHQEDFCQVFSLDPSRKYEADQGPGVQKIADVLRATTGDGSVERFVRAVIVTYLLGAPDRHAKNYSVLLIGRSVRLAPMYDLSSGLAAVREGMLRFPRCAMSIGGARGFGQVDAPNWDKFAVVCGLPAEQVREWVREYASSVTDALRDTITEIPPSAVDIGVLTGAVLPRVAQLADLTLDGLSSVKPGRGSVREAQSRELASIGTSAD
jgi:serine/threonine-protein kinase HipA